MVRGSGPQAVSTTSAGASVDELKRLRELEAENAKLKRMYAELALENACPPGSQAPEAEV